MNALSASFSVRRVSRPPLSLASALAVAAALLGPDLLADSVNQNVLNQISALQAEKESRTPAQLKLDSQIHHALKLSRNQPISPGAATTIRPFLTLEQDGRLQVDIQAVVSADLLTFINQNGGTVINNVPRFNAVRA